MGQARIKQTRIGFRPAILASTPSKFDLPRQRQLPLPWHLIRPVNHSGFAHPAEEELANILSFYRVRWLYEPTSFALEWSDDGRPTQSFIPDFYLPDHHLYIEVTTMRQPLVTRKNRKLRMLRELYPGVQIKLLYRRDVEQIFRSFRVHSSSPSRFKPGDLVATVASIKERIEELACGIGEWNHSQIRSTDAPNPLMVIGLAPGALTFKRNLVNVLRACGMHVEVDRIMATRYRMPGGRKHVRIVKSPRSSVTGKDVLLVADVVSTGLSVRYLVEWLMRNGARRVEVCSLFTRTRSRLIDFNIRFQGFEAPDAPIVGFGIGKIARHRALPHVVTLEEETTSDRDYA